MDVPFSALVFQEGDSVVGYSPELDLSSCGATADEARQNLRAAVRAFVQQAKEMGTLEEVLTECGYVRGTSEEWLGPKMVALESMHTLAE
ncbi:MAG: type II toxin-antitoxin system HicB family antitoxin [Armatimonadota bacterium]